MLPTVSILIPCFNAEQWINEAIVSSLKQNYEKKEIIVVDDGSTDNSWEIITSFGSKIYAEKTLNKGAGAARNYLLRLCKGEWLQYLDADDYLLPDKITRQVECVESNSETDIVYSPAIVEIHWQQDIKKYICRIPDHPDIWITHIKWDLPQTGACLWRKQAIIDVGGWKEDQPCCQENELYLRLLKFGKRFSYCGVSGAVYRKWSDDTVCERDKGESVRQRLNIIDETERFLAKEGQLSYNRQDAINQARFECARIIWNYNRNWARSVMKQVADTNVPFIPRGRNAPYIYRYLYSILGFSGTEIIAGIRRKIAELF